MYHQWRPEPGDPRPPPEREARICGKLGGMAVLRDLEGDERLRYFRGVLPLWGGGLGEEQFVAYQRRLAASEEAAGRYRLLGLFEAAPGPLLSAMKVYTLPAAWGGRRLRALGIGAVFTPPALRRRGFAAEMLRQALAASRGAADVALLFTDIGTGYYRKLGFTPLESGQCLVEAHRLPRGGGHRPAAPREADEVTRILSLGRSPGGAFTLLRDGWVTRFQLRRLRELARIREVGEPEWGVLASARDGEGAAMIRHTRDAIDVLDAAWTSPSARDALLAGLRDCAQRSGRPFLRLWPAHQLRGLYDARPRTTAVAMAAMLGPGPAPSEGEPSELTLLDHI
jgi:Acetyltransferase (GNAT) domain